MPAAQEASVEGKPAINAGGHVVIAHAVQRCTAALFDSMRFAAVIGSMEGCADVPSHGTVSFYATAGVFSPCFE